MPKLSVFFIRTAFFYLIIGYVLGSIILVNKAFNFNPFIWSLLPIHIKIVFWGWLLQLIFGVAFWILPRFPNFEKSKPVTFAYFGLNTSLLCSILGDLVKINDYSFLNYNYLFVFSIGLLFISLFSFASHILKRIKNLKIEI